jgi:tRNA A37 methylthiotransferase MiaB
MAKKLDRVELVVLHRQSEKIVDELMEHRARGKADIALMGGDLRTFCDDVKRAVDELLDLRASK